MVGKKSARLWPWLRKHWLPLAACLVYYAASYVFTGVGCLFYSIVGLPCPGCGGTRALTALLGGDIAAALHWHPLIILMLCAALLGAILFLTRESMPVWWKTVLWCLIVLLLVVYAVRMALYFPLTPPMDLNEHAWLPRLWAWVSQIF